MSEANAAAAPDVSIVIIANAPSAYLMQALDAIKAIESPAWEVVGVLNDPFDGDDPRIRFFASGLVGPAEKRDLASSQARAPILAFLDDDAYPSPGWLAAAMAQFANGTVVAVGGPGVTPPDDNFWQQVSGWVYSSVLGSAGLRYRYTPGRRRDVDDYPSMNLMVRKDAFQAVGGFNSAYYPGEDTKLCLELTERGGRIVYEPGALVYHHRRPLWPGHFRQIGAYGRHRGFFAKRYPETSRRPHYFIPSAWTAWLLLGALLSRPAPILRGLYRVSLLAYAVALLATGVDVARKSHRPALGGAVVPAVAATHVWYGVQFIRGLVAKQP